MGPPWERGGSPTGSPPPLGPIQFSAALLYRYNGVQKGKNGVESLFLRGYFWSFCNLDHVGVSTLAQMVVFGRRSRFAIHRAPFFGMS